MLVPWSIRAHHLFTFKHMMNRQKFIRLMAPAVALGLILPLMAAARENGSSAPVQYNSWVKAVDEKGDSNAIGKFNSNQANKRLAHFEGTVSAVSATSITVRRANSLGVVTTRTFIIDTSTVVIRKFKGTASVPEIAVGDRVQVWATALTGGTAKLIWDKSIWWVALKGTIADLNATDKTFNLVVTRKEPETGLPMTLTVPIRTSDSTIYLMGLDPKTFSDLANGQTVSVRGTFDAVLKSVLAKKITIL